MANNSGEHERPSRRDPYVGAPTSSSHLDGSSCSETSRKASEDLSVSVLISTGFELVTTLGIGVLLEHSIGTCDYFPIQNTIAESILGSLGPTLIVPQVCVECVVVEVWRLFA